MIQILKPSNLKEIKQIMRDISVDPYGIEIMLPKALGYLLKLNCISNITANILKQEMLSLGGDVALARDALTGKTKKTDCLLIGNFSQLNRLNKKLNRQPFGLNRIAQDLSCVLKNYQKDKFVLDLPRNRLLLGRRTRIMGVINLTPDSFSGDGLYTKFRRRRTSLRLASRPPAEDIILKAEKMVRDGADIIDLGGESSRPGAPAVSEKEELSRAIPAIKLLAKNIKVPISIDTYKPEVARQALDNGAQIVNDISGLRNQEMAKLIARYKAGVVIMHMKGKPRNMQNNPFYTSLITQILEYLKESVRRAQQAGIDEKRIVIDPGIGFGKTAEHNLEILNRLGEFKVLGKPILVGPSRKSFLGKILDTADPGKRIFGTVSASILAAKNGAKIIRAHDIKEVKQALKVQDCINNA